MTNGPVRGSLVVDAPSSNPLTRYGINTVTLGLIAKHVSEVKDLGRGEQTRIMDDLLEFCNSTNPVTGEKNALPDEMSAILDYRVKQYLITQKFFLEWCDLLGGPEKDGWDAIETGCARYCLEKYKN